MSVLWDSDWGKMEVSSAKYQVSSEVSSEGGMKHVSSVDQFLFVRFHLLRGGRLGEGDFVLEKYEKATPYR